MCLLSFNKVGRPSVYAYISYARLSEGRCSEGREKGIRKGRGKEEGEDEKVKREKGDREVETQGA